MSFPNVDLTTPLVPGSMVVDQYERVSESGLSEHGFAPFQSYAERP